MIELLNAASAQKEADADVTKAVETIILLLAPFAPHITEELWRRRGHPHSIHDQPWPEFDPETAKQEEVTMVIQVNGKVRYRMVVPAGMAEEEVRNMALGSERIKQWIEGVEINRVIVVLDRLVTIVVKR